jgi:hypothetical protein
MTAALKPLTDYIKSLDSEQERGYAELRARSTLDSTVPPYDTNLPASRAAEIDTRISGLLGCAASRR